MSLTPTTAFPDACGPRSPTHCNIHADGGTRYDAEFTRLLHGRLRVVTLIALTPTALFLAHDLLHHSRADGVLVALQAAVTLLIGSLAWFAWARRDLSYQVLRRLDLLLLGSMAAFFGWAQLRMMGRGDIFRVEALELDGLTMAELWIESSAVHWFFLVVIYGVFVPNTWRRCAMLTGATAMLPLVLTPLGAYWHGQSSPGVRHGLHDLFILMPTAWAVAVFGAHRLQELQRAAFEAKRLGQYHLGERLGAGGMGEVFLGEHVLLRRRCAIKMIREDQAGDPATLGRFEREVQAMATLTHWNTVEVYDFGRTDGGAFYYVMEYLDGLNLDALVSRHGPLPAGRAIHFLRQVCAALREAHSVGLMHRDIKPSNVMACKRGGLTDVAKLLDFGLVQTLKPTAESLKLTVAGAVLGSPPYMSPEQAMGKRDVDARSDIYSLGGVGYYLLTGRPPFVRETAMEMMLAHAYEPPTPLSQVRLGVPKDLEALLLRCLSKKPDDRFADVAELSEALGRCGEAGEWDEARAAAWWGGVRGGDTLAPQLAQAVGAT